MRTTTTLWVPPDEDVLAVVRVTPDGDTSLLRYLGDIPDDAERELDAIQQRWTQRCTWPGDTVIQAAARIREYVKYPEEDPRLLGVRTTLNGKTITLAPKDVELVYRDE